MLFKCYIIYCDVISNIKAILRNRLQQLKARNVYSTFCTCGCGTLNDENKKEHEKCAALIFTTKKNYLRFY